MILNANQNHLNLKTDYPLWAHRIKKIAKIWRDLPNDKRQPYIQAARENRTASPVDKQVRSTLFFQKCYFYYEGTIFCIISQLVHE